MTLDKLRAQDMQPHLQSSFFISMEAGGREAGEPLELKLIRVEGPSERAGGGERPFSLFWLGPRDPILPQRIYPLQHPHAEIGTLEIFLVPVGRDASGTLYQAVFG